jgi:hemolysin III
MALFGVTAKLLHRLQHPLWSTGLYVAMGWVAVVAVAPLVARMPGPGLAWLVAGGALYTAGAVVSFVDSRVRYAHFAWHLFVLGGSACHFLAVLCYAR